MAEPDEPGPVKQGGPVMDSEHRELLLELISEIRQMRSQMQGLYLALSRRAVEVGMGSK